MTERQLLTRVRLWQKRLALLGVSHWRITVSLVDDIDDEIDCHARVDTDALYDTADFEFRRSSVDKRSAGLELDELIVHEWLHVADRDTDVSVREILSYLSPGAEAAENHRWTSAKEGRVERLARLIVKLVQLAEPNKES